MTAGSLAIIVAVKGAEDNLAAILCSLAPAAHPDVDYLICVAGHELAGRIERFPNVSIVGAPAESLVPHLWRDGIRLAKAERVALTTAHCIPHKDWVDLLLEADTTRWPGIGGVIDNDPKASASNWAVFFLRYLAFAPPRQAGVVHDLAADNAIYRRAAILAHPDLLDIGFWEPSFHQRFVAAGESLYLDPSIIVVHHGLERPADFVRHRHAHGREYGLARGSGRSIGRRLALLLVSPFVPIVIIGRILLRMKSRSHYVMHLPRAFGWLVCFVFAWASGETRGYFAALMTKGE